jgi:hypothetical protein
MKKTYRVRVYLGKASYPVQLDRFIINASNKAEAMLLARRNIKRKNVAYPLSHYFIDISEAMK